MSKAYPKQVRMDVVMEIKGGSSITAAAKKFKVIISTARNWWLAYVKDGRLEPKPRGGDRHSHRSKQHAERIIGWVEAQPDLTLAEIREKLAELGYSLAISTIWALLEREGYTRQKKTGHASEQARDDVEAMRWEWKKNQTSSSGPLAGMKKFFLDECSVNTKMARSHGWAKRGKRCKVSIPFGHWHTNTLLTAMSEDGMHAPFLLKGPLDGPTFLHWVKNMLLNEVSEGAVVIRDNASLHKVAGVREALAEMGVNLLYLPPYSPDLNPIEKAFSQIKSYLRKVAARTYEEMVDATGKALGRVTSQIACNYIRGCGYTLDVN